MAEPNSFIRELAKFEFRDINKHLNWVFEIKDSELRKDYQHYCITRRPFYFFLVLSLVLTLLALPIGFLVSINILITNSTKRLFVTGAIITMIALVCLSISSWVFVFQTFYPSLLKYDKINSLIFIFTLTITIIIRVLRYAFVPCNSLASVIEQSFGQMCESNYDSLSWDTGAYLFVSQIVFLTVFKETRLVLIFSSFFIELACIGAISLTYQPNGFAFVFLWAFLGAFVIYSLHIENIKMYFLNRAVLESFLNNVSMQEHNHANEMRHMIANVAHDLKTPLTSFISGVHVIEDVLLECNERYNEGCLSLENCYLKMKSIGEYLEDIRNTNSFMLMSINRCIDYTKASKGMKLVPRYETIDLLETLRLPLNCMRNIQNRIQICLKPIAEDICSHIITDKQWLQENILCLLSNAVKYSSEGEVCVTLSFDSSSSHTARTKRKDEMKLKLLNHKDNSLRQGSQLHIEKIGSNDNSNTGPKHKKRRDSISLVSAFRFSTKVANQVKPSNIDDETTDSMLKFEVEDHGIGMNSQAMEALFNPFKQNQRLAGGTGLGLYSLAKRIEALNGHYGVKKRKDGKQGSLFWFTIPYKPDEVMASMATQQRLAQTLHIGKSKYSKHHRDSSPQNLKIPSLDPNDIPKKNSLNILVVDDSPSILKMTSLMLKKQGFSVDTAENGAIAVDMIENKWNQTSSNYDLVLMDLQMPVMDGLEATRRIRSAESGLKNSATTMSSSTKSFNDHPRRPHQIIIGCSANSDSETTEEAIEAGVDSFMAKPFTMDTFFIVISRHITKIS